MCKIKGCKSKIVAKGLCAKHYMRKRRTGDPNETRKPGRKQNERGKLLQDLFSAWSPRTRARFAAAHQLLQASDLDHDEQQKVLKHAIRPNGSVNVLRFYEMALASYLGADAVCAAAAPISEQP